MSLSLSLSLIAHSVAHSLDRYLHKNTTSRPKLGGSQVAAVEEVPCARFILCSFVPSFIPFIHSFIHPIHRPSTAKGRRHGDLLFDHELHWPCWRPKEGSHGSHQVRSLSDRRVGWRTGRASSQERQRSMVNLPVPSCTLRV